MPRKKKEPKRYKDEAEIIKEIDKTKHKINFLRMEADIVDRFAEVMRDYPNFPNLDSKFVVTGLEYREKAERDRKYADSLENNRLKKLGEALAVMKTGILPLVIADESIPA